MTKRLPSVLRLFATLQVLFGTALPAMAQVTIFSPFNIAEAMDPGVKKTADVPYADGQRKKLDIYQPKDLTGSAPVVMFIYGGSWRAGDKFEYEFAGRALAALPPMDDLPPPPGAGGKRLDFNQGEPTVPVRLMENTREVVFRPRGEMRLTTQGPIQKTLEAPAGSRWRVRLLSGKPAVMKSSFPL